MLGYYCQGSLWDSTFWGENPPVLTQCLENSVALVPVIFLIIVGCPHVYAQSGREAKKLPASILHLAKIVIGLLLFLLHSTEIYLKYTNDNSTISDVSSETARALSFILVCIILTIDRNNGISSSLFVVIFWILVLIFEAPVYYRYLLTAFGPDNYQLKLVNPIDFSIKVTSYPLIVAQFVLAAISEDISKLKGETIKRNPFYYASPLSKALYGFFTDLVILGYRKTLALTDLPPPLDAMQSEHCYNRWKNTVSKYESAGRKVSLLKSMLVTYWADICLSWIMAMSFIFTRVSSFLVLNELIIYLSQPQHPIWKGYVYSVLIFVVYLISSLMVRWADYFAVNLGLKLKAVLIGAIVRKSLRVSGTLLGKYTVGELVNLLSVDADKINQFSFYVGIMIGCPFYIALCTILLWMFLGPACLAGISVIIVMMPLTGTVAALSRTIQVKQMDLKDTRLKYIGEILSSIKIIKFYGWEPPFADRVQKVRFDENVLLKKLAYLIATLRFFWSVTPFLVSLFAFIAYLYVNDFTMIETNVAFVSLSLFNSMRFSLSVIPDIISNGVQTFVSVRRIEKFLNAEELQDDLVGKEPGDGNVAKWSNATLSWGEDAKEATLDSLNLEIKTGELVAIVGKVGAGKSSLLSSVLGDMKLLNGEVHFKGSIAYVPQQAWIQNETIRNNILFTKPLRKNTYKRVIEKCCLSTDLRIMPGGEQTEIGEKGVNLSGGQKQRISLARAVYQDRDVYLLDDPLSAVDAHVGSAIFRDVIGNNGMLKGKTRIFVTNMLSVLPYVDRIVVLENGKIIEQGSYEALKSASSAFSDFLKEHSANEKKEQPENDASHEQEHLEAERQRTLSIVSTESIQNGGTDNNLISEEVMQSGSVNLSVYGRYFAKVGVPLCVLIIAGFAGARTFDVWSGIWLSEWSKDEAGNEEKHYAQRSKRILIYAALGMLYGGLSFVGTAALANGTITAARKLHNVMLNSIIRAPMSFFDTTPVGRLLNRFGKDVDQLDIQLPVVANLFLEMFFQLAGVMILITMNVPIFLAISSPLLFLYFLFQRLYMRSIRQLKRMESVTRSPVYNHFGETLNGLSSIRAYCAQRDFICMSDEKVDSTQNCSYLLFIGKMWLGTRLDIISNFIVLVSNILIVMQRGIIDPGVAGYIVSYSMGTSFAFNFIVHYASEVEAAIVASERIDEYSDVKPEAPWKTQTSPEETWPAEGRVEFDRYSTRYREGLDLVLRDINLDVSPGEKIGVVGRTGAGKSSLTLSLFRIIEAAEGRLKIDNIDISKIGLHELRPRLTIIPQDPVIFSGSLRINLDPNTIHQDDELWNALERAHVKEHFVEAGGLDMEVAEGGSNLSVGQRQLICLARAILQRKQILIMDEATAAVDVETDALIQSTIRLDFADCTVITIAHRLNTIMDSDRVVVMDAGQIVEEGNPKKLLADSNSLFHGMAKEAGLVAGS